MEEGETRNTVKKRHDNGALIEVLLVRPPCLQGAARHVKHLRGLTLGEALGLQMAIPLTQFSAFDTVPALMAVNIDTWLILDDGAHSSLLFLNHCHGAKRWLRMARSLSCCNPYRCPTDDCLGPSSRSSGRCRDRGRNFYFWTGMPCTL